MAKFKDLTGQRFGRLIVIERVISDNSKRKHTKWMCKCDCGNLKVVYANHLKAGTTLSCGCLSKEKASLRGRKSKIGERSYKHGDFGTKLYGVWAGIKRRCQNENTKYYKDYGGRGIKICEEWKEYKAFKEWALLTGYQEGLTIERINVDGDYCPSNCKWIPLKEQGENRRNTIRLEYQGNFYTIKEIAEMTGLKERTIAGRYERGWDTKKIITTKIMKSRYE